MPSATYRMHQKLSDGSYQAIHVESESGVILRPNGDTVEQTLRCCVLAEDAGDNVPGFVVDADTLGGSTKEEIISTAQAGVDLSNIDAATLGGSTKEQIIAAVPTYTHPSAIQCSASTEINSLKSSVSSGKTLIANAITGKGVATSSSATFATMASNIASIETRDVFDNGLQQLSESFYFFFDLNTAAELGYSDDGSENVVKLQSGGTIQCTNGSTFTLDRFYTSFGSYNYSGDYIQFGAYASNISGNCVPFGTIRFAEPTSTGIDPIKNSVQLEVVGASGKFRTTCTSASYSKSSRRLTFTLRFTQYYSYGADRTYTVSNTTQNHVFTLTLKESSYIACSPELSPASGDPVYSFPIGVDDLNISASAASSRS